MVATRIAGRDGRLRGASETLQTRGASAVAPIAHGWRYAEDGAWDSRFDLLRGFAVFAMVVDHIGGASWADGLTGGNRFFVSAAEGFVFISGMVVGIVYGGVARAHGVRAAITNSCDEPGSCTSWPSG